MKQVTPELLVEDLQASLDFYTGSLEFKIEMVSPEDNPVFALVKKGQASVVLYERKAFEEEIPQFKGKDIGGTLALNIDVEDVSGWYEKLQEKVKIIQELHSTEYGTQEFSFEDNSGYVLILAEDKS